MSLLNVAYKMCAAIIARRLHEIIGNTLKSTQFVRHSRSTGDPIHLVVAGGHAEGPRDAGGPPLVARTAAGAPERTGLQDDYEQAKSRLVPTGHRGPTGMHPVTSPFYCQLNSGHGRDIECADDTVLVAKTRRVAEILLHSLEKHARKRGLRLNKDKTVELPLNTTEPVHYSTGETVPTTVSMKYLGVM
eukprot:5957390-Alexandrium_andersonii.AAC.1